MLIKPNKLKKGDKVAIVSLSRGTLGEKSASHQLKQGLLRLKALGLVPVIMPNALRGVTYLAQNPQARANDLKTAFLSPQIKGIFCAIGGIDTYRILPFLLEDQEFIESVQAHPKLFSGFSDTTIDHLMFYKLGMQSFYGPNFLNDLAELGSNLLPYTAQTLQSYFHNPSEKALEISPVWYEERHDFSKKVLNTERIAHQERHGYQVLRGKGEISGRLLGGCLESLGDMLKGDLPQTVAEPRIIARYHLFPSLAQWQDRILFIETSAASPKVTTWRRLLEVLAEQGIFQVIKGILVGKPQNEVKYEAFKKELLRATAPWQVPIIYNLNFGHAYPRTALPYGIKVKVDLNQAKVTICEPFFAD